MTMTNAVKTSRRRGCGSKLLSRETVAAGAGAGCQRGWTVCLRRKVDEEFIASRAARVDGHARKNVTFFPSPALAEAAGYQGLYERCEPDRTEAKADPQAEAITAVTEYLKDHAEERTRLADVAKATGVGRLTILRGFKRVLGVSPGQYAKEARLERFKSKVREPKKVKAPITDAIYEAGFGSSSRLYEKSAATLGMTPRVMREGGAGLLIRYCTAGSPLGRMLVATTEIWESVRLRLARDDKELVAGTAGAVFEGSTGGRPREILDGLAEAVAFVTSQLGGAPVGGYVPDGCEGDGFSTAGLEGAAGDSARRDAKLFGGGAAVGCAYGFAGGCGSVWGKSDCDCGAVSSSGGQGWSVDWISVGRGEEAAIAGG